MGSTRNGRIQISSGRGHAVVVGGSIAGLLAAVALARHAERVTIVERDRYPLRPEPRKGVPQSKHTHLLLDGGRFALDSLLPGLDSELLAAGALDIPAPTAYLQRLRDRWFGRWATSGGSLCLTRPVLEHHVRERVLAEPRVEVIEGADVTGLTGDAERVTGVLLRRRGAGPDREPEPLPAELVVDASGRSSRTPDWLTALGARPPAEERVESGIGYVTRVYRDGTGGALTDARLIVMVEDTLGAVILPVSDDGTAMVTFSTPPGEPLPADPEEFEALADRLSHPIVRQWLDRSEGISPVHRYLRTENVRRAYDAVVPDGLLVTGDAMCAFNPVFGQGMSAAAVAAVALDDGLAAGRTGRSVQKSLLRSAVSPWAIAAGGDKQRPGVTGNAARRTVGDKVKSWYLGRVQDRCPVNEEVQQVFRQVMQLSAPPTDLFRPAVLRSVLFQAPAPPGGEPRLWLDDTTDRAPAGR